MIFSSDANDGNRWCCIRKRDTFRWRDATRFSDLTNLSLRYDIIAVSSSARNLGFIFDSDMSFSDQINSLSKSCHFHIRDIRRILHLLPLSAATALANSLVSSKLDYCNSLYSGISQANLNKLQRIQNSLARVITNTSKYQHITPTLKTTLASNQTKNRVQTLSSHIQNTYKSTTYISLQYCLSFSFSFSFSRKDGELVSRGNMIPSRKYKAQCFDGQGYKKISVWPRCYWRDPVINWSCL